MTELFNKKSAKKIRRILRKQPISAEQKIWQRLRRRQLNYRILRQFGIGQHVVDFYCPNKRLVIEIDGETHSKEEIINDKIREEYLIKLGLKIKRYSNHEIYNDIESVLFDIYEELNRI